MQLTLPLTSGDFREPAPNELVYFVYRADHRIAVLYKYRHWERGEMTSRWFRLGLGEPLGNEYQITPVAGIHY